MREMPREDLLRIRELIAEGGVEITPQRVLELINSVKPTKVVDKPGLVSFMRDQKEKRKND